MKSYDSRTYSINDFVEWDKARQLLLNPSFQRRPVWTEKAKSFLMDTIIRGKPIPKFFIRQKINVSTKSSVREVVDGQQRLRTILSYIKDGFVISKQQNPDYGGFYYSQLPQPIQEQILAYEVSVDLLINMSDPDVLDVFSRINSYAVVLNEQEKINADHFGPFKVLADRVGHKYFSYWTEQKILTPKNVMRMQEVSLVADLLIAMVEGIKSKKQIKKFYDIYESNFDKNAQELEDQFDLVMRKISLVFQDGLSGTEFKRPHLFYSLFTAFAHREFGLPGIRLPQGQISDANSEYIRNKLDRIGEVFNPEDGDDLTEEEVQFLVDSRRATTDEKVRARRTAYLLEIMA